MEGVRVILYHRDHIGLAVSRCSNTCQFGSNSSLIELAGLAGAIAGGAYAPDVDGIGRHLFELHGEHLGRCADLQVPVAPAVSGSINRTQLRYDMPVCGSAKETSLKTFPEAENLSVQPRSFAVLASGENSEVISPGLLAGILAKSMLSDWSVMIFKSSPED